MSNSLCRYGLYPTRLLCPWGSPGTNTGVGCPSPGELPNPGIEPVPLKSPALTGGFFTTSATWEDLDSSTSLQMTQFHFFPWLSWASQVVLVVKNALASARDIRDMGWIPELARSPGGGHGNPLQYSWLENPMEGGAWLAAVCRVAQSQIRLK